MKHLKSYMRLLSLVLALSLAACLLSGCGEDAAETEAATVTVMSEGEAVTRLEIVDKTQDSLTLTAVTEAEGDITWSSSDAGVVKVESSNGDTVTLTPLKVGYAKITASCGQASGSCVVVITKNQDELSESEIALTLKDINYSVEKINFYFVNAYSSFVSYYGSYASYYGLDTSTGTAGLADQSCDYSEDGTWKGYFLETAIGNFIDYTALCDYAKAEGLTLDEDELAGIQEEMDSLLDTAVDAGYATVAGYIKAAYGDNATPELYEEYLKDEALADKAYNYYSGNLTYTDEEIAGHYAEMGYEEGENDYATRRMRHILIKAEADDDGEYTEEAIAAAHDAIQVIYDEWLAGEATEDSFAALANEYSVDSGSNENGGLYENIYEDQMITPINDFLFDESRQAGDVTIVDYDDSYTGTHLVYYAGEGQLYSTYLSLKDLKSDALTAWLEELTADYTITEGAAYSEIGEF